jgi:hypothetical protein
MTPLKRAWHDVLASITAPEAISALVNALDNRGDLASLKDRLLAEAADDLRADHLPRPSVGQLARAVTLIEGGAPKARVLAAGISRRTYFRARRQCQQCQATPAHPSV